jgi:hypothetical protein
LGLSDKNAAMLGAYNVIELQGPIEHYFGTVKPALLETLLQGFFKIAILSALSSLALSYALEYVLHDSVDNLLVILGEFGVIEVSDRLKNDVFFKNFLRVLFVWVEANLQIDYPQLSFLVALSAPELLVELSTSFLCSLIGIHVLIRKLTIIKESARWGSTFLTCRRIPILCLSLPANSGHRRGHNVPHYLVGFIGNLGHRLIVDKLCHLAFF